jgi:hypothetical protein
MTLPRLWPTRTMRPYRNITGPHDASIGLLVESPQHVDAATDDVVPARHVLRRHVEVARGIAGDVKHGRAQCRCDDTLPEY